MRFLPFGFIFDWPEFLLGILVGVLLAWVARNFWPALLKMPDKLKEQLTSIPLPELSTEINPYRDQLSAYLDRMHIPAPLFDLREIIIEPYILTPPPFADPNREDDTSSSTLTVLPTLPDWNPLSAIYHAPSIPLKKLVGRAGNILLTGEPGSGRSTALMFITLYLLASPKKAEGQKRLIPILIHAADLRLYSAARDPLKAVLHAVQRTISFKNFRKISSLISRQVQKEQAVLLLDGLDELPVSEHQNLNQFLQAFTASYPGIQIIATGDPCQMHLYQIASLVPVPLAPWTSHDYAKFTNRWENAWQRNIMPRLPRRLADINPTLINGWLQPTLMGLTPLECTLRTWSAYAGDLRGNSTVDALQAYLNRMLSPPEQKGAEQAAFSWISNFLAGNHTLTESARETIPDLINAGFCRTGSTNKRILFSNSAVGAFLAAKALSGAGIPSEIVLSHTGIGETLLRYYSGLTDSAEVVRIRLQEENPVLQSQILSCARWLREAVPGSTWRSAVLAGLAQIISKEDYAFGLRLRATHALVHACEQNASQLFIHMLSRPDPRSKVLGALGLGGIGYIDGITEIIMAIRNDPNPLVRQACTLALSALGSDRALETLGRLLLQGNEQAQGIAAAALPCNIDEGHQMLRDALEMKEAGVRRAAVLGLERVHANWVDEYLNTLKLDDDEWVVRNAALQISEHRASPPLFFIPQKADLHQLSWLISFAAKQGLGVPSGRAAQEVLRRAITQGSIEESIAGLEAVIWYADDEFLPEVNQNLRSDDFYRKDSAFEVLWKLSLLKQTSTEVQQNSEFALED
ncbi:MAG: hypothetical protein JXA25_01305 [Anaerolineales bacterium]|nr:hypothetical protein [Anaerolineales bacterium]